MSKKTQGKEPTVKANIVIDTNKLIEIWSEWTLDEIKMFVGESKVFVFSRQICEEFIRNIDKVLDQKFNNDGGKLPQIKINGYSKEIKKKLCEIQKRLDGTKEAMKKELIEKAEYLTLFIDKNVVAETTEEILKAARQRKEKGNPPSSGTSIGDEIIWESFLTWKKQNIIMVAGDNTWHANTTFLKKEYEKMTGKKLVDVVANLSQAKKIIGEQEEILKLEAIERKTESGSNWTSALVSHLGTLGAISSFSESMKTLQASLRMATLGVNLHELQVNTQKIADLQNNMSSLTASLAKVPLIDLSLQNIILPTVQRLKGGDDE